MDTFEHLVQAAQAAQERRDWTAATDLWDACLRDYSNNKQVPAWRSMRAWSLGQSGRLEEAELEYREHLKLRPQSAAGLAGLAQIARLRKDWVAASERLKECLETFPAAAGALSWRGWLADSLLELGRIGEAEEIYRALASDQPDSPVGFAGLARSAERRQAWAEAVERWDACIARFPDHPRGWRIARARSLGRRKLWPEAYEAWDALVQEDGTDEISLVGRSRAHLKSMGPDLAAEQLIDGLLTLFPDKLAARKLHADLARLRGDEQEAMERYLKCIDINRDDVESYSLAMVIALHLGNLSAGAAIRARASQRLTATDEFRCRVLLPYYDLFKKFEAGTATVNSINIHKISISSVIRILKFLRASHNYVLMRNLLRVFMNRFPKEPRIIGLYLTAIRHTANDEIFENEKTSVLAPLSEPEAYEILSILRSGWLSAAEVRRLIDFEFSDERKGRVNFGNIARLAFRRDPETLAYVADRITTQGGVAGRLIGEALLSQVRDREKIDLANLRATAWSDFRQSAQMVAAGYEETLAKASDGAGRSDRLLDLSLQLRSLAGRSNTVLIDSAESYHEAAEFASWLRERIRRREPTSVLRLCDGEGNFIPYPEAYREFQESDQRAIQQTWWNGARIVGADAESIMSRFVEAIRRADAIGVPPQIRMAIILRDRLMNPIQRGIASALAFVSELGAEGLDGKVITSCGINHDLEDWDLFRQIFQPLSEISVISCHDLNRVLAERFGLAVRQSRRISAEFAFSSMFSGLDGTKTPLYPDEFNAIMETIAPERGEVFLIAAGFLGKFMCDRIRERGGIGIDIGSTADLWMGHSTRSRDLSEIDFDITSSLIEGQPFSDNFDAASLSPSGPCRSDRTRRRNLSPTFDRFFDSTGDQSERRFAVRIIGHPRCGSRYTSNVLTSLGLDIGHERPGKLGLCSWIHAVDDLNPPYRAPPLQTAAFAATIAYVRNPKDAIPSIMLENCRGGSLAFRRFHIARRLGVDIAKRRDPFERAVESYLAWMQIIEQQRPRLVLRVEYLLEELKAHDKELIECGLAIDWQHEAAAISLPKNINSTSLEFRDNKPTVAPERYRSLPPDLQTALQSFCVRHGYPFPASAAHQQS